MKQVHVSPKTVEVMAALLAVQFSKEVGFMDVMFEGDAVQVVKEIQFEHSSFSRLGHLLECIQSEMQSFRMVNFYYIPRGCNKAADTLAKEASQNCLDLVWLEETPRCVRDIVCREQHCP
jgi:ribonuclease HI